MIHKCHYIVFFYKWWTACKEAYLPPVAFINIALYKVRGRDLAILAIFLRMSYVPGRWPSVGALALNKSLPSWNLLLIPLYQAWLQI